MTVIQVEGGAMPGAGPAEELRLRLARLQAGAAAEPYPTARRRIDRLNRCIAMLVDERERIAAAIAADYGHRSWHQTMIAEIFTTVEALKHARSHVNRWMRPERRRLPLHLALLGARGRVFHQPVGVVGVVGPWNFPVNLLLAPLAGILAAGNRALLKPSEHTPATAELLAELVAGRFDADEIAMATGGRAVAEAFCRLPFDHLIYTGGGEVARLVMRAAAENLVPVTLELGGKSPVVIGTGADLAMAARRIVGGKMLNMGQVCLAPDYILVAAGQRDALVAALTAEIARLAPEGAGGADVSAIVNQNHYDRLAAYLADAARRGAAIVTAPGQAPLPEGRRMPITLVVDPPADARVMAEEIFGPLIVVRSTAGFEAAVEAIRERPRPLALYYFGRDRGEIDRLTRETVSGALVIGDVIMHYTVEDLPFGGAGASGMGAYHGIDGFRRFSVPKAVYRQTFLDTSALVRPPFGPRRSRLLDLAIRK
ncbi:aldehyde dehydrogenase family protein [Zavarzinia aquatilis]|uniref:Aldehyde dehydrogenase n=1 Tax=Zavarzinia aquatilis TaxID=2211142 RepID=A0A317DZZ4_9PROT|nr:aldehyde dehydrogenase family protein [Zavarzinia aquatilis]PWR20299.1 coniferyl aldehyde dehydrogenase [Zavarzinia aquatilis]